MTNRDACTLIIDEADRAEAAHGHYTSLHEAYAVLLEEVDELWDIVKLKKKDRRREDLIEEVTQIGAIALKILRDCKEGSNFYV